MELPICRWRGPQTTNTHWECTSPKLIHGPNGVRGEDCRTCYLRNHPPPSSSSPPPIRRQVVTAIVAYSRWIAAGRPRPSPDQLQERQSLCSTCPERRTVSGEDRCGKCGCPLGKVTHFFGTVERPGKLEMSTEECPLGKWKTLYPLEVINGPESTTKEDQLLSQTNRTG